ncbi:uncharacterized protein [Miscanthus floridulus]|uniref:uncharacterized protein n=1 Tax=Miscanthus floridulus TaxID=154761 RepID=UPI00345AD9A1
MYERKLLAQKLKGKKNCISFHGSESYPIQISELKHKGVVWTSNTPDHELVDFVLVGEPEYDKVIEEYEEEILVQEGAQEPVGVHFPSLYTGTIVNSLLLPAGIPRYNLRSKRVKREIKMPPKRASWMEDETKLLLDLCLQEKEKCNFTQQGLTMAGWSNIYTYFPCFDKKQCNNKLGYLKKAYLTWKDGLTATRLGRNPHTGAIATNSEYWETQEVPQPMNSDDSQPEVLRGRQPQFLDQLEALFRDCNQNIGCFVSAGGIRDSMPPAVLRRLDLGGPSSNHSSSKRDTMYHVVNSLEKKKNCNVGEYIARLSESIAARSASRDRERTRMCSQLAANWNMDNSDEESQNSSENSFNKMVKAAMAAGLVVVHMLHVPPQGAMDGTHIEVIVDKGVRDNHINRKGKPTQNVVAVCDIDMRFTYVGAGTEGSAHDMRVKRKAEADPSFPHPPSGQYYLVDSGYALRPRYLMSYPNKRYWVKEFETKGPVDA